MRWAWRIATVAGIPVYLHGTFLVLLAFLFLSDWFDGRSVTAALGGLFFVVAVFVTIVLHEFGHALVARRYGIKTRDITLLPIGGVARLERMPSIPRQELWVALAGPAVNVVIAVATYVLDRVLFAAVPLAGLEPGQGATLDRFFAVNVWLVIFNLIPAFPMDGGRALRALLAERYDYARATDIAATLGQGLALLLGFVGLFSNPFLVFIALFVWMGATTEASAVTMRTVLAGVPVERAMMTEFHVLGAADSLRDVAQLVVAGSQRDFPVVEQGTVVGILTRDRLISALAERGADSIVGDVMLTAFETVAPRDPLEGAFTRLQLPECPMLPVMLENRLVGLLTADNIGEYVMMRGALTTPSAAAR